MTQVHQTEIDGVRCFWVESGRPTLAASLVFRGGKVDESVDTSGWLHLLEHMALHDSPSGGALQVNGAVSLFMTTFECHGPVDAVVRHLEATSSWLSRPDLENLSRERGVLHAEGRMRSGQVLDALLNRYGTRGPGLAGLPEFGLGRVDEDALREVAGLTFTSSNAALVLDGPPPQGLRLSLSEGEGVRPLPSAVPCSQSMPSAYVDLRGTIASGTSERSVGATLLPALIQSGLRDELRHRDGAAYAPWSHYEAIDADTAILMAGSDVAAEVRSSSVETMARIVSDIAAKGPDARHLANITAAMIQTMTDPYNAAGFAMRAAQAHLQQKPDEGRDQIINDLRDVKIEELLDAALSFRRTVLYGADSSARLPDGVHRLGRKIVPSVRGTQFRHRNWPAERDVLAIGHLTAQIAFGERAIEVRQKELAALVTYPDGRRMLFDHDGWNITVDPAEWHRGAKAVEAIDRWAPASLHLPQPAYDRTPEPFRRASLWKRWATPAGAAARRHLPVALVCVGLAIAVIAVAALVVNQRIGAGAALFPLILLVRLIFSGSATDSRAPRNRDWGRFGDG